MKKTIAAVLAIIVVVLAVLLLRERVRMRSRGPTAAKQLRHGSRASRSLLAGLGEAFAVDNDPQGKLRLEGQVLGAQDYPVGGALVTINSNPRRTTKTEQDGSFVFEKLVGRSYTVWAQNGDFIGGPVVHELNPTSEPVVIRLRRGAVVEVTVVAEGGKAIGGAQLELRASSKLAATTNEAGQAVFRGAEEGSLVLVAKAAGYATGRQLVDVPPEARSPVQAHVELRPAVAISGRVIDEAGQAVRGARVLASEATSLVGGLVEEEYDAETTDAEGRFSFAALTAGAYWLSAKHEAFGPGSAGPVTVSSDRVSDVEIKLAAGAILGGKVVSKVGKPVAWAAVRVALEEATPFNMGNQRQVTADESGVFKFRGLSRTKVVVAASAEEGASEVAAVDLAATPQREDLVLTLGVLGTIAGTVVDENGEPVAEAQVMLVPDIFSKDFIRQILLRGVGGQITDGGGRFSFRGLSEGTYRLRAGRTGMTEQAMRMQKGVEARTGEQNVKIVLPKPGGIKGTVRYQDGRPVPSYRVTVAGSSPVPIADTAGTFAIRELPAGTYDVHIRGAGFLAVKRANVEIKPSSVADLGVITVQRGRAVAGRVLDGKGVAVAGATVVVGEQLLGDGQSVVAEIGSALEEHFGVFRAQSSADGSYQIVGIGNGELVAIADHREQGRSVARPVAAGDKDVPMDLTLQPVGSLEGRVLVGGKAMGGLAVSVKHPGVIRQSFVVTTSEQGSFLVERLPAGAYDVIAISGSELGGKTGGAKVTVEAGKRASASIAIDVGEVTLEVEVRGEGGTEIDFAQVILFKGQVTLRNGKEVNDAVIRLSPSGGAALSFARGGGSAEFKNLVPAEYSVCVLPITGDINDPSFQNRLQKHAEQLAAHCRPCTVASAPKAQTFTATVPPMVPFSE